MTRRSIIAHGLLAALAVACEGGGGRRLGESCQRPGDCTSNFCYASACQDPDGDDDGDGLVNAAEVSLGTNPFSADTDGDGVRDGDEVGIDSQPDDGDGDGIPDVLESLVADPDGDCIPDQLDAHNDHADAPCVQTPSITITPHAPSTADDLVAESTGAPPDATLEFAWTRDGRATAYAGTTVPASATSRGERWRVEVVAHVGGHTSERAASEVTIVNSSPAVERVAISLDAPTAADTVHCTVGAITDADGDPVTLSHAWETARDAAGWETLAGAQGAHLALTSLAIGARLRCSVTPHDGVDAGPTVASAAVTVAPFIPPAPSVTLGPAEPTEASVLRCEATADIPTELGAATFRHQWRVDDQPIGASGATLTGTAFDRGDHVGCEAWAIVAGVAGPRGSSNILTIGDTPPRLGAVALTPTAPDGSSTLVCAFEGWADPDPADATPVVAYTWLVDDAPLVGVTEATLAASSLHPGVRVRCRVTPGAAPGAGDPVDSPERLMGNSPPAIVLDGTLTTSEDQPTTLVVGGTDDWDANTLDVEVTALPSHGRLDRTTGAAPLTLRYTPDPDYEGGDSFTVVVIDAQGARSQERTVAITVMPVDDPPTVPTVTLGPTPATEATTLACAASGSTDVEGAPITYSYRWQVDGRLVPDAVGATLTGATFDEGAVVRCSAWSIASGVASASVTSAPVTILNSPPEVTSVTLAPEVADGSTTLECGAELHDLDPGDVVTPHFAWLTDDVVIEGATTPTLAARSRRAGDTIRCVVTPHDGDVAGPSRVSSPVLLGDAPPIARSLAPLSASVGHPITLSLGGSDDWDAEPELDVEVLTQPSSGALSVTGGDAPLEVTYTPGASLGDAGFSYRVLDRAGTASTTVFVAITVGPDRPPTPPVVTLVEAGADELSTLTCDAWGSIDPEGDPVDYIYAWYVDDTYLVPGRSMTGTHFDKHQVVRCGAAARAGDQGTATVWSEPVTIANVPPLFGPVSLTPARGDGATRFTCALEGWVDPDPADALPRVVYTWRAAGVTLPDTGSTLDARDVGPVQDLQCVVWPRDEDEVGEPVASPIVTLENAAPTALPVPRIMVAAGGTRAVTLSGRDDYDEPADLAVHVALPPAHGRLDVLDGAAPLQVTYTADAGYLGADAFTFRVTDSRGAESEGVTVTLAVGPAPTGPRVLRVDPSATGDGSGATWADAMPDVEAALAIARDGDAIWVARAPEGSPPFTARSIAADVALVGGFSGHGGGAGLAEGSSAARARPIAPTRMAGPVSVVARAFTMDGVAIIGGTGGITLVGRDGDAIVTLSDIVLAELEGDVIGHAPLELAGLARAEIADTRIEGNDMTTAADPRAAAIFAAGVGELRLERVVVTGNVGPGIVTALRGDTYARDLEVIGNVSTSPTSGALDLAGGALELEAVEVRDNVLSAPAATLRGEARSVARSGSGEPPGPARVSLSGVHFAAHDAGHLLLEGIDAVIRGSRFERGTARDGGAVRAGAETRLTIVDCDFEDNQAVGIPLGDVRHGAVGGAIATSGWTHVEGCRFFGNTGIAGAAIGARGELAVVNSLFGENRIAATQSRVRASVLYAAGPTTVAHMTAGAGNDSPLFLRGSPAPLAIHNSLFGGAAFPFFYRPFPTMSGSCAPWGVDGVSNVSWNPAIETPIDPAAPPRGYHLRPGSVCEDAGSVAAATAAFGSDAWRTMSTRVDARTESQVDGVGAEVPDPGVHHFVSGLCGGAFPGPSDTILQVWSTVQTFPGGNVILRTVPAGEPFFVTFNGYNVVPDRFEVYVDEVLVSEVDTGPTPNLTLQHCFAASREPRLVRVRKTNDTGGYVALWTH